MSTDSAPSPATVSGSPLPRAGAAPSPAGPGRLMSLDAYRGFIVFLLASAGFGTVQMARKFPDTAWADIGTQFVHTAWEWGVLWDLIMPSFMFMVGVAMPFSFSRRQREGDPYRRQLGHAVIRALVLCAIGTALMAQHSRFLNVLTQIGLGYVFVFLLLNRPFRTQLTVMAAILVGYWLLFALYPLPGPDYNFARLGLKPGDILEGFRGHWSKHANIAGDFDRWLLNLFPQDKPFVTYIGGVQTLNFIPSMANMILGVMSGQVLMSARSGARKFRWLVVAGAVCMTVGVTAGLTICPVVKKIWTPSFALYSGAWTLWMLAAFYWIIDLRGWRGWAFPLVVFGVNSLVVYIMTLLWPAWIVRMLKIQFGSSLFTGTYGPIWEKTTVLLLLWLFCWWLYRRKLFFRI